MGIASGPPMADGERVLADVQYTAYTGARIFEIAVTDQAVFLRRSKGFSYWRKYFFERVGIGDVRSVSVKPLPAWRWIALAPVFFAIGAYAAYVLWLPLLRGGSGRFSIYPLVLMVIGAILPFAARRRFGLMIAGPDWTYSWKPDFVLGGAARKRQQDVISTITGAFRTAGIPVLDERGGMSPS